MLKRTVNAVNMRGAQQWLRVATAWMLLATISAGHHRRSMPTQATLPLSKGGWRPVIGSGGLLYGPYGPSPLHAPSYKIPISLDSFPSSARPVTTRDAAKLTSIVQSYRPTTTRSVQAGQASPQANQPINSYHNPFLVGNKGISQYKYNHNFPSENIIIRNPHNPYLARPIYKIPQKFKQQNLQHSLFQQVSNIQPLSVNQGHQNQGKPHDHQQSKPSETTKKPHSNTEIFKQEVYKLPDSDTAPQSLNQQVKTAQQQHSAVAQKPPLTSYQQYLYNNDAVLSPNVAAPYYTGAFGAFSSKAPFFPPVKTTYVPVQSTKQTLFNSFSYTPNYRPTTNFFPTTTQKSLPTLSHFHFGSTINDFQPTQQTKPSSPPKVDPNVGTKDSFKPSPQDPFIKYNNNDYNKITPSSYNPPSTSTTTLSNIFFNSYSAPSQHQQNSQLLNYYDQQTVNENYEKKKHKIHDNFAAAGFNQDTPFFVTPSKESFDLEGTPKAVPHKATYEVTENNESDNILITHPSPTTWGTSDPFNFNHHKATEETIIKPEYQESAFDKPTTTQNIPEEFAIVTEAEKGLENSLNYDNQFESQSRRPVGDDFEPIGQHKLKDYYYKVSTPAYEDQFKPRRTKKPSGSSRPSASADVTTLQTINKDVNHLLDSLPTLPPTQHYKRPTTPETADKYKNRKRNKPRRRRPGGLANVNRYREDNSTRKQNIQSSTEPIRNTEEFSTNKPRIRPFKHKPFATTTTTTSTTPSHDTTDLTTSALPTVAPTYPTIVKKKLSHRRPSPTTTDKFEITTQNLNYKEYDSNKESPIMKITSRQQQSKSTAANHFKASDTPDYSHKQDEKDTPTSDVSVLTDTLKTRPNDFDSFSFHRDVKPIEAKLEPITNRETTTEYFRDTTELSANELTTTIPRAEYSETTSRSQRPRLKNNKYEANRPRFSVKDYRNRLSSTTSTTEKSVDSHTPKIRFPQRRIPTHNDNKFNSENDNGTERKKFTPKEPRHKNNGTELTEQAEKEIHTIRHHIRQRPSTESSDSATQKISSRVRNVTRRPKPTEETTETTSATTTHKRNLRKKIKDSDLSESVQDISVTETTVHYDHKDDATSERTRSESAIMKIADKKHHDPVEHIFEHSKRVSDLTLAASKDYNNPGIFKTVNSSSRRIPSYFTIATDDPILPIEAFFPQLNQKKES